MTGVLPDMLPPRGDRRLLGGGRRLDVAEHLARFGPLPWAAAPGLADLAHRAGLRGRGGAGFPFGRKLTAVAAGRSRPVVVVNGCEGEPLSRKDHALMDLSPHLILDGAMLCAAALDADDIVLCVHRGDPAGALLRAAAAERHREPIVASVVEVPDRYVASEESSLVNFINTGTARPTSKPPRPFERGVRGCPTLISNVETFAHLALIARFGPDWFRDQGTADSPGTALMTMGGAVRRPGVYELALGVTVEEAVATAGGTGLAPQAVLIGGYAGGWLPLPRAGAVRLEHAALRAAGASLGVASLTVLPATACGIVETARIAAYLAGESARQCGPCMFGLPSVADDLRILAAGVGRDRALRDRLRRRMTLLAGRGACGHPDGFTRLLDSALRTFGDDVRDHLHDRPCRGSLLRPVIPVPRAGQPGTGGWR